jgi:putative ABC transport system substrate-binding protein
MRRREFIAGLSSAVALPLSARAQQPKMPVVGFLSLGAPEGVGIAAPSFRKGLNETGFIEDRSVTIEYRFANNAGTERLAELAADLVGRRVTVIAASGLGEAIAAKAATATIPIVFRTSNDPVRYGLVASFNRPGGNVTGIYDIGRDLAGKRLGLLRELLTAASRFAALVEPGGRATESTVAEVTAAASAIGSSIEVITASTNREIDTAFANLVQKRIDALWVSTNALFASRRGQLVTLAAYHRMPAIYPERGYAEAGGLMSYGPRFPGQFSSSRHLYRAHPQGRETIRPAGDAADQVRVGHQPQDRQGDRPRNSRDAAHACRRRDRMIGRRYFITLLGTAAAWPVAARSQQGDRVRRIGVLMGGDENDPVWKARHSALTQALAGLGWTDGRNMRMDARWGGADINRLGLHPSV